MGIVIRKSWKLLWFAGALGAGYFFQYNFALPFLSIGHWLPDCQLILTVYIGYRYGAVAGSFFGFFSGLMQDVMIDFYGLYALSKTLAGYTASYTASRHVLLIERIYLPVVVAALAMFHDGIYYGIYVLGVPMSWRTMMVTYALPNAIYSGIIMFLLLLLIPKRLLAHLPASE